jgi:hypothetical protein
MSATASDQSVGANVSARATPTDPPPDPVPLDEAIYCTVDEAVALGMSATADPALQEQATQDASRLVDWYTDKRFMPVTDTRMVVISADGTVIAGMPIWDVSPVNDGGSTWPGPMLWDGGSTIFQCYNGVALINGWPGHPVGGGRSAMVRVTGTMGYLSPPTSVRRATARLAAMILPSAFEPGSDVEGVAVGRVPGLPPIDDLTDPEPPRVEANPADRATRTTGDSVSDELLRQWVTKARLS